jgi:uncharacterized protein YkwD
MSGVSRSLPLRLRLAAVTVALGFGLACQPASAEPENLSMHTRWARFLAPEGRCRGDRSPNVSSAVKELAAMCLINWARGRAHERRLTFSAQLESTAMMKVLGMVRCNEFSHTACGHDVIWWFERSGYLPAASYTVGENIAATSGARGGVRDTMLAWLNSPGHRANILNRDFRQQGLAVYEPSSFLGRPGILVWSSDFGVRSR